MEPVLEIRNVSHVYGADTPFEHVALDNVSLTVGRGEFVGLIGHTGSGKSTLIQHMNGLLKPSNGQVLFEGQDVWSDAKLTRRLRFHVGLVFQYPEYQLFEETVFQDIAFGPKNMGLSEDEVRRAAIAGVIAMERDVLILDEPTAGLDPVGRESILENIRAYQAAQGASVIMVSHSMEEIASNVDRLLVMNDSHLVMDATPAEVFAKPEELVQMGLAVPKVTQVLLKLRELGVDVPASAFTVEQAEKLLLPLLKGGKAAC